VRPQVAGRPVSLLLGLQTFHPFAYCPSWAPIGAASLAEKVAAMHDPALRAKLLAEVDAAIAPMKQFLDPARAFPMGMVPDYEPSPESSVAALARAQGRPEMEVFYDALLADDGLGLVLRPLLNYTDFSLDAVREMLLHPSSAWGLGDGGAHCGTTCDASTPTYMLAHWARDRAHDRLPLEWIVKKMTADTASMYGLGDRGVLAPGKIGDVNVIDYESLQLERPEMVFDLPADGRRFVQKARGYITTVKSGEVIMQNGEDVGARPGALLRGAR
jgi:N-acyl-D-aspartate/D-glutamate deacylase